VDILLRKKCINTESAQFPFCLSRILAVLVRIRDERIDPLEAALTLRRTHALFLHQEMPIYPREPEVRFCSVTSGGPLSVGDSSKAVSDVLSSGTRGHPGVLSPRPPVWRPG
jgi:hypothetical protein